MLVKAPVGRRDDAAVDETATDRPNPRLEARVAIVDALLEDAQRVEASPAVDLDRRREVAQVARLAALQFPEHRSIDHGVLADAPRSVDFNPRGVLADARRSA